jgi:RHS repeat-associated protein
VGLTEVNLTGIWCISQNITYKVDYYFDFGFYTLRKLKDASGAIVLTKTYKPYGEVLSSSGTGSSMYGFDGEQTDVTGMIYLRARYYAPNLIRLPLPDAGRGRARTEGCGGFPRIDI